VSALSNQDNNVSPEVTMDKIGTTEGFSVSAETLNDIIEHERIISHFQPIISLKNKSLLGLEALSRSSYGQGIIVPPDILFAAARRHGKSVELDRLCRGKAIDQFRKMQASRIGGDRSLQLFLNFDTSLLDLGVAGSGFLRKQFSQFNIPPGQVVIEIVESQVEDTAALSKFTQDYRDQGFIIALDDVGSGHSNFDRITIIKPDIIKIDRSIISGIDRDYYKQEIFKALVRLSRKTGTLVLAEGVESIEECLRVLDCDTDLLQGFYFARPTTPENISLAALNETAAHAADRFRDGKINKINKLSDLYSAYRAMIEKMKSTLSSHPHDRFEALLRMTLEESPLVEAAYVLDKNGIMITDTVIKDCRRVKTNMLFQKAQKGDDLSLKEYYYLLISTGLQNYATGSYISWATGNLTRTISASFDDLSGGTNILCIDVPVDSTLDLF
jgi:EAL domain-containing protein (putative c-di-GMP-specific phosphodiesterase class I)